MTPEERKKRIAYLEDQIFCIYQQDHISREDYDWIGRNRRAIEELENADNK